MTATLSEELHLELVQVMTVGMLDALAGEEYDPDVHDIDKDVAIRVVVESIARVDRSAAMLAEHYRESPQTVRDACYQSGRACGAQLLAEFLGLGAPMLE